MLLTLVIAPCPQLDFKNELVSVEINIKVNKYCRSIVHCYFMPTNFVNECEQMKPYCKVLVDLINKSR